MGVKCRAQARCPRCSRQNCTLVAVAALGQGPGAEAQFTDSHQGFKEELEGLSCPPSRKTYSRWNVSPPVAPPGFGASSGSCLPHPSCDMPVAALFCDCNRDPGSTGDSAESVWRAV